VVLHSTNPNPTLSTSVHSLDSLAPSKIILNLTGICYAHIRELGNESVTDFLHSERAAVQAEKANIMELANSNSAHHNKGSHTHVSTTQITVTKVDGQVDDQHVNVTETTMKKLSEKKNTELEAPEHHREKIRRNLKNLGIKSSRNKRAFERQHSPSFSHHRGDEMDAVSSNFIQADHTETNFDDLEPTTITTTEKIATDEDLATGELGNIRRETRSISFVPPSPGAPTPTNGAGATRLFLPPPPPPSTPGSVPPPLMSPPPPRRTEEEKTRKVTFGKDESSNNSNNNSNNNNNNSNSNNNVDEEEEPNRLSQLHKLPEEVDLYSAKSIKNIHASAMTINAKKTTGSGISSAGSKKR